MLSTPNMKDVHDANLSFFSPQPFFIGGFFLPQQILQVAWLYQLYQKPTREAGADNNQDVDLMVDYAPYYALGDFCVASKSVSCRLQTLD